MSADNAPPTLLLVKTRADAFAPPDIHWIPKATDVSKLSLAHQTLRLTYKMQSTDADATATTT